MAPLSDVTGWIAVAPFVAASLVPLVHRLVERRRAAPDSPPTRVHVVLGLATAAFALLHTMAMLPSLGEPAAVAGGMRALGPGALAFFLLWAHVGVGLQLRRPRLAHRASKRRLHATIAATIAIVIVVHVVFVRAARL